MGNSFTTETNSIDDVMRVHLQVIKEKHKPGRSRYDYGTPSQEG